MLKKVVILGSNSFAGRQCAVYLADVGHEVIGVSRSALPEPLYFDFEPYFDSRAFRFYQIDINDDWAKLKKLLTQEKPAYIIDMAGQGMVAESWQNPEQWYQTNILAKVKLHHWLKDCDWLDKYIRVSTPEVYGNTPTAIKENQPFYPSTPYAVSHAATDMSLMTFHQQYGFPVVLTRFANFYGPGQQLYRIVPRTFIYASLNKKLSLHGGGTSRRAFIHGHDVSSALSAVMEKGAVGETYHFSTDEVVSIRDLVSAIAEQCDISLDQLCEISEDRPGKDAQYFMDWNKARTELNWQPEVSLIQGLSQTGDWVQRNIQQIKDMNLNYEHKA
jgi:dTDP-glucose 4,6-dehydratase